MRLIHFFFLISISCNAQYELNSFAKKMSNSEIIENKRVIDNIRAAAIEIWNDNDMYIITTINQQVSAFENLKDYVASKNIEPYPAVFLDAMETWVAEKHKIRLGKTIRENPKNILYCCEINWMMVNLSIE